LLGGGDSLSQIAGLALGSGFLGDSLGGLGSFGGLGGFGASPLGYASADPFAMDPQSMLAQSVLSGLI
jgi:hypothetical protein